MFYTKKSNGETLYFDTDCIKKILIETSEVSTSKNELLKAVKKYVDSNFDPKKLYEKNEENSSKDIFSLSESDEDNLIGRKLKRIPELVSRKLMQKGKTIEEINPDILDKGQESELKYADLSIWHNKEEVDKFVQNKLNLSDEIVKNTVYADGKQKLWSRVQVVITELRNEGLIKDWTDVPGGAVRTGVWRLKNSIVEKEDSVKTKRSFFTAVGPWKNWNHSKTNLPMRWGIINGPAKADYDLLNNEDIVFFYSTKTEPSPFEKKGFFGVGKVTKKFESVSPFWPDEVEKNEIFYKHQFYLEILKISEQDKDVLDWIEGLPFTKGLNHIVDEEKLNQLINNTKSKWNLDFSKSIETISGVKDDETIDEMDDVELKEINPNELEEGIKKIKDNFLVNEDTIREIVINLVGRRHIILAGPIGTGKTELARMIPRIFWKENQGYFTEEHTATADWNTTDVIGGIMPKMKDDKPTYEIQLGCVSSTIVKNWKDLTCKKRVAKKIDGKTSNGTWLLIDEFNRADIDKAFGQLFTSLESKNLKIPSSGKQSFTEIKIPKDYRIIGTLNTADKSYLFHLSDALKRRFAYIEVNPPGIEEKEYEIFYALKNAMIKDTEKNYEVNIGPLKFNVRIDRIDKLVGGELIILDYKTGNNPISRKGLFSQEIDDLQLAIYACYTPLKKVSGAGVALINRKDNKLYGITSHKNLNLSKTFNAKIDSKEVRTWDELLSQWGQIIKEAALSYKDGECGIKFKDNTEFKYCRILPLLRLPEKRYQYECGYE